MRHKGNISEIQIERNRSIQDIYTSIKRTMRHSTVYGICREVANTEVERHYISEERAYVIYMEWIIYGTVTADSHWKLLLYINFIFLCDSIPRNNRTIKDIVREALSYRAPCMGISPNRIMRIVSEGGLR